MVQKCIELLDIIVVEVGTDDTYEVNSFALYQESVQRKAEDYKNEVIKSLIGYLRLEGVKRSFDSIRDMPSMIPVQSHHATYTSQASLLNLSILASAAATENANISMG